jgi:hypothetical protein
MKNMTREGERKEKLDLVTKGLFLLGSILVITGLALGFFIPFGFLLSGMGVLAMVSALIMKKKPEYLLLLIGW